MIKLAVYPADFDAISKYLCSQKEYWHPINDAIAYRGRIYKVFFIDDKSKHISYLMMKYDVLEFTKIWDDANMMLTLTRQFVYNT